ncbi:MAG: adenosine-specific kinase [Candidatus Omnitrophica bacterium]|nr:adenosine-specific kinase [Candidatus Omnitrophota bacterium]MDD5429222.1 adenosine-specific kinase [Candidatus Omnitrophota bacterium]
MELEIIKVEKPLGLNVIIGQAHFIKTVEDIYEVLVGSVPSIRFGLAFCEASDECLVRSQSNNKDLEKIAVRNSLKIGCGHMFFLAIEGAYPVNILNQIKQVPEVCRIFCATANPLEVIICQTAQGRGILGVVDGFAPKGKETEAGVIKRKKLLRKLGYKL